MHYHFVGLDKVCNPDGAESVQSVENSHGRSTNPPDTVTINTSNLHANNTNSVDGSLDETTIEESDECTRQITGGAQVSMMAVENPEALPQILCIAPAEGQTPLSIMTDPTFEVTRNPDKCFLVLEDLTLTDKGK